MHVYISASKVNNFQLFPSNRVQTLLSVIASTSLGAKNLQNFKFCRAPRSTFGKISPSTPVVC